MHVYRDNGFCDIPRDHREEPNPFCREKIYKWIQNLSGTVIEFYNTIANFFNVKPFSTCIISLLAYTTLL